MSFSDIAESDLSAVFMTDFAVDVCATTWGTTFKGIFDRDLVDVGDFTSEAPYITIERANLPATYAAGNLFDIDATTYRLVDVQYIEPGLVRVILADT